MHEKGKEKKVGQHIGEVVLAISPIVWELIAMLLEHIDACISNFPAALKERDTGG